ncbi:MAG TPA: exonuclease domain-containing protein [Burkholderiaceae bacterium]|jgi:DNA polymerase-3 subunit epsilon|nr:exonuclease domain-containing protein [Burkholderiaceae bacterium]
MGLLSRLLRSRPSLGPELEVRLQRLSELSPPPTRSTHRQSRYVTVDVETTGLDMRHDHVLSIGAVAVEHGVIALAHCFEVVLRQAESSSHDNILVHRIGGQRQLGGEDPAESFVRFLEYVGHCPLVAFRAEFDQTMLDRALKEHLNIVSQSQWLDLAELLPALYPSNENKTMDDWLAAMNIHMLARHDALADALATAQMLQVCLRQAESLEMTCPAHLLEMQRAQHWLGKR